MGASIREVMLVLLTEGILNIRSIFLEVEFHISCFPCFRGGLLTLDGVYLDIIKYSLGLARSDDMTCLLRTCLILLRK